MCYRRDYARNPFEEFDSRRREEIKKSMGGSAEVFGTLKRNSTMSPAGTENKKYIVKFRDEITLSRIYEIVRELDYSLLADSAQRIFLITLDDFNSFMDEHGDMVSCIEEDIQNRQISAATNDPYLPQVWAYREMNVYDAWNYTGGDADVTVAVLDTGISRDHEDFAGSLILSGYDALTQKANVTSDASGHGTAVCGLIAATANNKIGSAGISYGATIMPVKITDDPNYIQSSNVIKGLYFAADAGADIINMSFSGQSKRTTEEGAIKYALNKGCILIAAAGNHGETDYGDMPEYPASYDGVISVASVGENGDASTFSQRNEYIDIAAPGESIYIMKYENNESRYYTDSGTSYSAAYVSGIAALAVSYLDEDVTFGSEEFMSLLKYTGGKWNRFRGYGIINASRVLEQVNYPIVTGIFDGETYINKVNITYNRGDAILDGIPQYAKTLEVMKNGSHTFVVSYGEYSRTINFYVDNKPLTYNHSDDYTVFTFERGSATLDGVPYASGQKITKSGDHVFVLSGPYSNSVSKRFTLNLDLPYVVGVTDGGIYDTPVCIRIIGSGSSTLDGISFTGETIVGTEGSHTLVVTNSTLTQSRTYTFKIQSNNVKTFDSDILNVNDSVKPIVDEKHGYVVLYTKNTQGINVYSINNLTNSLYFTRMDKLTGYDIDEDYLYLFHDSKITRILRSKVKSGFGTKEEFNIGESMTACVRIADNIYYTVGTSLKKYSLSDRGITPILQLDIRIDKMFFSNDGNFLYMFNTRDDINSIIIFNIASGTVINELTDLLPANTYEKKIVYGSGMFAIGGVVINEQSLWRVSENISENPIKFYGNLLFTDKHIINTVTNECLAVFYEKVSDVYIGADNKVYVFYENGFIDVISNSANPISDFSPSKFRAAVYNEVISAGSTEQSLYMSFCNIYRERNISSFAIYGEWMYILCENIPVLYKINADTLVQVDQIPLLHMPKQVFVSDDNVYVSFKEAAFVYSAQASLGGYGEYTEIGFIPQELVVADNKLISVRDGAVTIFNIVEEILYNTGIAAGGVYADNSLIYVYNSRTLSIYDLASLTLTDSFNTGINISSFSVSGNYIYSAGRIYDLVTKKQVYNTGGQILTGRGNTVFTQNGLFSLKSLAYLSDFSAGGLYHYLDERYNYYSVSADKILRVASANGTDLTEMPDVELLEHDNEGSEQDGIFNDNITIKYNYGYGYIGTEQFGSGSIFSVGGANTLTIVLPCGITKKVDFYIIPALESIRFANRERYMSVNETIMLHIQYLPEEASPVAVNFRTKDIDIIKINNNGLVTALNVGTATVYAESTDGRFITECKIRVSRALLKFNAGAKYKIDRNDLLVKGIPAGTKASEVLAALDAEGEVQLLDSEGNPFDGVVGTGMILVLMNSIGEEIDKLSLCVLGDLSGDGYISTEDLYVYREIFKGGDFNQAVLEAADIDGSNNITESDVSALRAQIMGYDKSVEVVALPPVSSGMKIYAFMNSRIYDREKVIVAIQLEGALGAYAVSGTLDFNADLLEYKGVREQSWSLITHNENGFISFIAYDSDKTGSTRNTRTVLEIEFVLREGALGRQVLFDLNNIIAVSGGLSYSVLGSQTLRRVNLRSNGEFKLKINNADNFVFSKDIFEYDIIVKSSVAALDIDYEYPFGASCIVGNTIIPDNDVLEIMVIYKDPEGESFTYTINVKREKEVIPDNNCYLSYLFVKGFSISPEFHRSTLRYSLTVPYEVKKLTLEFSPESDNCDTELSNPDLKVGENTIRITCIAEDGNVKIYTVMVTREAETSVSQKPENSEAEPISLNGIYIACVVLPLIAALIYIVVRRRVKKSIKKE